MEVMADFRLLQPATLAEAIATRRARPESRFLAGGTDLIANLRRGIGAPPDLIDLTAIGELRGITVADGAIRIGAAVTLAALLADSRIQALPLVVAAANAIAGPSHREMATVGGNLCLDTRCVFYNQSAWWRASNDHCRKYKGTVCHVAPTGDRCHAAYSGDLAPALLVLDATAELAGPDGVRRVTLDQLFADDGEAHLRLGRDEILVAVDVRPETGLRADYAKARLRGAIDFPLAGVAVALRRERNVLTALRVALTGTNSHPFLIEGLGALIGRPLDEAALRSLDKAVQKQVSPMRTTIAAPHYRRRVAAALARRLAARLFAEGPS
jgi:4-hydroxybenzoyl-CoA reductase subunit beta